MTPPGGSSGWLAVPFDLPDHQVELLRGDVTTWLAGDREDLRSPDRLRDPSTTLRRARMYERLLIGFDQRRLILPDEEARIAVVEAVDAHDECHSYDYVVSTHDAQRALVEILSRPGLR